MREEEETEGWEQVWWKMARLGEMRSIEAIDRTLQPRFDEDMKEENVQM